MPASLVVVYSGEWNRWNTTLTANDGAPFAGLGNASVRWVKISTARQTRGTNNEKIAYNRVDGAGLCHDFCDIGVLRERR
jgi:hypothetical protein